MGEGRDVMFDHHQGCGKRSGHAREVAFRWLVGGVETQVRLAEIQGLHVQLRRSGTAQL